MRPIEGESRMQEPNDPAGIRHEMMHKSPELDALDNLQKHIVGPEEGRAFAALAHLMLQRVRTRVAKLTSDENPTQ